MVAATVPDTPTSDPATHVVSSVAILLHSPVAVVDVPCPHVVLDTTLGEKEMVAWI